MSQEVSPSREAVSLPAAHAFAVDELIEKQNRLAQEYNKIREASTALIQEYLSAKGIDPAGYSYDPSTRMLVPEQPTAQAQVHAEAPTTES